MAIKRLGRIWMKSGKDAASRPSRDDPSFDDFCPIDSQVQEEMVRSFERANDQQSLLWRRYHVYFMEDVESWMIIAADWVAILACSFSIIGIVSKSSYQRRWLWCSFFVSILLSVFWLYFMMRLPRFRWEVIWRPFGPLSGAGICLYVDHLLAESSEEIRKLRGYMYSYKAT
ncbi:uncharacterized protein LOC111461536 isoform X3 [Cucurbita moschata]|uniref:Uncharacterized protein LOC111461536 isoform X3 n=1 Tax=Cucurbita moschata TaxID=3662 RepID=A0A6J1HAA3_CUCMO|nr:uncharacterized protein LOC111461536 isoform X3 [Cucurbita moschata]